MKTHVMLPDLTGKQLEILNGSLLGDGCLRSTGKDNQNINFTKIQSKYDKDAKDKYNYMLWHFESLMPFSTTLSERQVHGKIMHTNGDWFMDETVDHVYERYTLSTHCHPQFTDMEKQWYVDVDHPWYKRRKVVPNNLRLTPLALCIWYMDDGYNNAKDANIELNTQGFSKDEVHFLIERLRIDLGINSKPKNAKRKEMKKPDQYKIYIGRKSYFDFIELIKPCVRWNCFHYKLDTSAYTKQPHRGETHSLAKLTEEKVREIFKLFDDGWKNKEIAAKMGLTNSSISRIVSGKHWQHLGLKREVKRKPRLSKETRHQILLLDAQCKSQNQIATELDINQSTVSRCLREVSQCQELN